MLLISTTQLTDSYVTPANGRLPGEASSIGRISCDKSKWIQWHRESAATRVDDVYESTRCYKRNLMIASDRLVGRSKLQHVEACSSAHRPATARHLFTCLLAKEILLELKQLTSDHPHIGINSSSVHIYGAPFSHY